MAGDAIVGGGGERSCVAAAQEEKANSGEAEEERVHGDDVVDDLRVGSGESDEDGPDALQGDGNDRDARAGMNPGDAAKEDTVFSHGEIDARCGEDGLAEKAEGGKGDARGDKRGAAWTECATHHDRSRSSGPSEPHRTERADVNKIHGSVDGDDAENAEDEPARESLARVANFPAEKAGGLPAAVGEEDGSHRGTEGEGEIERRRLVEKRVKGNLRGAAAEKTEEFEHADGGDRDERHGGLHAAAGTDAEAIDRSEKRQGRGGDERIVDGPLREFEEIARERDGDGGHATSLNDEKQHPAVKKCDAGMERFAKISVLAADHGQPRGQFGVNEAAKERDEAAGNPHRQDEEACVDAFGDEIRIDENSRTDDAAHHCHGGAEKAEMARKPAAG